MGRRRRSGVSEFFDGFNASYQTINQVLSDKELSDIAKAEEVDNSAFTPEQGKQLEDAAAKGASITYDEAKKAYVVTPADGGQAQDVSMARQGVSFLGKDYDKPLTDSQKDQARMQAMAGVYSKFGDPIKAMDMKAKAQANELQGIQLDTAKRTADRTKLLDEASNAASAWMKGRVKLGEDGQPMPLSDEDFVLGGKQRVLELAKRGLYDEAQQAGTQAMEYASRKIQAETQERTAGIRDAVARAMQGDYTAALSVYNKYIPDGSTATNAKLNKDGSITIERTSSIDGSKLPTGKFKDMDQFVSSLQSLADPNAATQYLARTFQHDIENKRLGIAGASLSLQQKADQRAQATFDAGAPGRDNATQAAKLQAVLAGTKDPAKRAEITQQINDLSGAAGTDANAPSEVKLANAAIKAGLHTDMKTALEWATKSKDLSPDKMRFEIYKTALTQSMGDASKAKEITDQAMKQFGGAAPKAAAPVKDATPADIKATAEKYGITEDEVKQRLGLK